jgi:ankyrin repeat protein
MVFGFFGGAKKRAAELYQAAQKGDLDGVRQALDKGADINALDPECGETALHAAVDKSQKAVVELLLSKGANPDIVSGQHYTPLIIAAAMGDAAMPMVELLLAGKASPELAPTTGPNAGGSPMHIAASKGANTILSRLLAAGAKPKALPNGSTLMHMAAIGGNAETVEIASKNGIPVDCTDSQARTPLHLTALTGNSAVARKLLELGAPVDKRDGEDSTPLMHATLQNKPNVVDLLLKKGANPDIVVKTGDSILSPLYGAAINGLDPIVKLLLAAGVQADKKVGQFPTAAEMAAHAGHNSTAAILKDAVKQRKAAAKAEKSNQQADQILQHVKDALSTLDYQSVIPLKDDKLFAKLPADWRLLVHTLFAEINGVKDALKDGANPNAILAEVKNGIPPLVAAAGIAKNLELVDVLLSAGADANLACSNGKSALMYAAENSNSEIVERLISAGSNVNATLSDDPDDPLSGLGAFGLALNRARINIAKMLLNNGARPEFGKVDTLPLVILEHGDLELVKAVEAGGVRLISDDKRGRAAFVSARNPDGEVFDYVLQHGGDVTADNDYKYTAITLAVLNNHGDLVKRYLTRGDDPNAEDIDRETALSLAIEKNHKDIVRNLRESGSQTREYPGLTQEHAMLKAASDGALGTILELRDAGVSLDVVDEEGNTPLMLATRGGQLGVVRSLYHLGADIDHRNQAGISATKIADEIEDTNLQAAMKEFVTEDSAPQGLGGLRLGGIWDAGNMMFGRMSHPGKQNPPYVDEPEEDPVQQFQEKIEQLRELLENEHVSSRIGEQGRAMIEQLIPAGVCNPEDVTEDAVQKIDQLIEKLTEIADSVDGESDENDGEDAGPPSPLFEAIEAGDVKEVKKLIKAGADPNETNGQGVSALMVAMMSGAEPVVDALIKSEVDVTYSMQDGKSALFLAVASGNDGMVKALLKRGAQLDEIYEVGHNGIEVSGCSPLYVASFVGHIDICRVLIKEGADINSCNDGGFNPLMAAIQGGHQDIVALLLKSGADVDPAVYSIIDHPSFNKVTTPLYIATQKEDLAVVKLLLNAKADVNAQAGNGWTPLKCACHAGNEDLVKLFLKAGADVNIADENNYTPLMNAVSKGHEDIVKLLLKSDADTNVQSGDCSDDDEWEAGRTALMDAAVSGNITIARELLKHGAVPNLLNAKGRSALHSAVISCNTEMVTLLIKSGVDVNAYGSEEETRSAFDIAMKQWAGASEEERENGATAVLDLMLKNGMPADLSSASDTWIDLIMNGHWEIDGYLRKHGFAIDPNQPINFASPLFFVTAVGDSGMEAARGLLALGADPNYVSAAGLPVLLLAVRNGSIDLVKILLKAGANILTKSAVGATAYDLAVIYNHQDLIHLLIEEMNFKLPEVDKLDFDGNTALMRAVKAADVGAVKDAISREADAGIRDSKGYSPLTYAICHDLTDIVSLLRQSGAEHVNIEGNSADEQFVTAACRGAMGTLLDTLDAGVSLETENSDGDTAFTAAGAHPGVLRALAKLGANLGHQNIQGKTAYMIAAAANRVVVMEALREIGAPMDEPAELDAFAAMQAMARKIGSQGGTDEMDVAPDGEELVSAVISCDTRMVRKQLSAGVDVNYENDEGRTALIFALAALGRSEIGRRAERDLEQIVSMLVAAGADPNIGPFPPLILAAMGGRLHIVNALIRSGADINASADVPTDEDGGTTTLNALMLTLSPTEDDSIVDESVSLALVDAGIDLSFVSEDGSMAIHYAANCGMLKTLTAIIHKLPESINALDGSGNTPLIAAASSNQVGAIELLLRANADRTIRDSDGKTASDIALEEGNQEASVALS